MADDSKFGFRTPKAAEQGVLNLRKMREDNTYKVRVVLGIINRAKATMKKTPDPVKDKEISQAIAIWEKYLNKIKGGEEDEDGTQDTNKSQIEDDGIDNAGSFDMNLGSQNILTVKGQSRGLVVKLTKQGAYSIYYWKDDPANRFPTEVYLDGKKVYMPVRLLHMGFEPDDTNSEDNVGRIQTESKKIADEPDLKGHQPKKYYSGLSKKEKEQREKHFKKSKKMDDDNPKAYKKAPGDDQNTKPSKYTKAYKKKFEEVLKTKLSEKVFNKLEENATKSLKNKSEKTGAPYSILKKVYDRGMAAWKTGHRPGTTPQQWGLARVNSFLTGGKTSKTADKDLYSKWKNKD